MGITEALLEAHCDPALRNLHCDTPSQLYMLPRCGKVARLLRNRTASPINIDTSPPKEKLEVLCSGRGASAYWGISHPIHHYCFSWCGSIRCPLSFGVSYATGRIRIKPAQQLDCDAGRQIKIKGV